MKTNTILLVEDDADDLELTIRAFRGSGLNVEPEIRVARDGYDALVSLHGSRVLTAPPPLPAVVLLDLKLPGLDGFDVLRQIRAHARTRSLPVVILTSSVEPTDLLTGYGLGANSYVRKPGSFGDLLIAARQIAAYWLELNEPPLRG
jgi:two-component system response regulator